MDEMNSGGRCQRPRKPMAGGRGVSEPEKIDSDHDSRSSNQEITDKPSGYLEITKVPPTPAFELDLYTQARKALSFPSPVDIEDSQALSASISTVNSLPSGVLHLLKRQSDSRRRHKSCIRSQRKRSPRLQERFVGAISGLKLRILEN